MHFSEEPMPNKLKENLLSWGLIYKNANRVVDPEKPLPNNKLHAYFAKLIYLLGKAEEYNPHIAKFLEAIWHLDSDSFADFTNIYTANKKGIDCLALFRIPDWYKQRDAPNDPINPLKKLNSPLFLELAKKSCFLSDFAVDLSKMPSISEDNWPAIREFQESCPFVPIEVINTWIKYIILVGTIYPIVENDYAEHHRRDLCQLVSIDDVIFKAVQSDIDHCRMTHYKSPTSPGRAEELLLGMPPDNHTDLKAYIKDLAKKKDAFLVKYCSILAKHNKRAEVISFYNNAFQWCGY